LAAIDSCSSPTTEISYPIHHLDPDTRQTILDRIALSLTCQLSKMQDARCSQCKGRHWTASWAYSNTAPPDEARPSMSRHKDTKRPASIITAWGKGSIRRPDHATCASCSITVFGACFGYTEPRGFSVAVHASPPCEKIAKGKVAAIPWYDSMTEQVGSLWCASIMVSFHAYAFNDSSQSAQNMEGSKVSRPWLDH
jgi:hypothetical protein